jgi:hypothetical protein
MAHHVTIRFNDTTADSAILRALALRRIIAADKSDRIPEMQKVAGQEKRGFEVKARRRVPFLHTHIERA